MRRWRNRVYFSTLLAVLLAPACSLAAGPVAVAIENASTPTLCAEIDNVYLKLTSAAVRQFTIDAAHPAYARTLVAYRTTPAVRNCDMPTDPVHPPAPLPSPTYQTASRT